LAKQIEDMGADSIAIKDMSGILTPYDAFELVTKLKASLDIPIALHCHATSGLSSMTLLKAIEAGIDHIDTAISSMSMTYGHSPTESLVAALQGTDRDPGLDITLLEEIAAYFREVRKKYAPFEGQLRGVDSRILIAQVPGGMLTNMEAQLREQGAAHRFDEVLAEIPRIREDLGYIPLVTPTSQIVGTQAVLNVLTGERYKSISKETQAILKGEYGSAPAPFAAQLQHKVLAGNPAVTCRPADLIDNEVERLSAELLALAKEKDFTLAENSLDDVLIYALFPQIGLKFLQNRGNPAMFEPAPTLAAPSKPPSADAAVYTVAVNGKSYVASVDAAGSVAVTINGKTYVTDVTEGGDVKPVSTPTAASGCEIPAPLAGNIFKVLVKPGDVVEEGQVVIILEAMKMETEVSSPQAGTVSSIAIKDGASVSVGDILITL
jgi:oxaloacetate decarboxylase alpha subunit